MNKFFKYLHIFNIIVGVILGFVFLFIPESIPRNMIIMVGVGILIIEYKNILDLLKKDK